MYHGNTGVDIRICLYFSPTCVRTSLYLVKVSSLDLALPVLILILRIRRPDDSKYWFFLFSHSDISSQSLSSALYPVYSNKANIIDMLFESPNRGKVIISIELNEGKLDSHIQRKGLAKNDRYAIASVLGTYISMCREADKDPRKVLNDNLEQLEEIIERQRDS